MQDLKLGIPSSGIEYLNLTSKQNRFEEYLKTKVFLYNTFERNLASFTPDLVGDHMEIQFINYGDTELVYVFTSNNKNYAVLVGQPSIQFGVVKEEFDNLNKLALQNPEVIVKPHYYISNENREMYIAPYYFQARCIASQNNGWGLFIPEHYYRFALFSEEEKLLVNICIIANLIKLYNEEENLGLASCKIGGGDFILEKNWNVDAKTIDNTLQKMKLIAARKLINIPLNQYIELLKKEFLLNTYYKNIEERDPSILINHKASVPMDKDDIEKGVQLGLKLRNK